MSHPFIQNSLKWFIRKLEYSPMFLFFPLKFSEVTLALGRAFYSKNKNKNKICDMNGVSMLLNCKPRVSSISLAKTNSILHTQERWKLVFHIKWVIGDGNIKSFMRQASGAWKTLGGHRKTQGRLCAQRWVSAFPTQHLQSPGEHVCSGYSMVSLFMYDWRNKGGI